MSVTDFAALAGVGMSALGPVQSFVGKDLWTVSYPRGAPDDRSRSDQDLPAGVYVARAPRLRGEPEPSRSDAPNLTDALREAFDTGLAGLVTKAAARGANSLVGVGFEVELLEHPQPSRRLDIPYLLTNLLLQARLTATAVKAPTPFVTALPATEVALLVREGWLPTRVALGLGVATDDVPTGAYAEVARRWGGPSCPDGELAFATSAVKRARAFARLSVTELLAGDDLTLLRPESTMHLEDEADEGVLMLFTVVTCLGSGAARVGSPSPSSFSATVSL